MQARLRISNPSPLPLRRVGGSFGVRRAGRKDAPLMQQALSEAALPRGFRFAATACGLKKTGALDLAILSSDVPASAAAVFTQNLVVAAPVLISKEHLRAAKGKMRAVVVNAGNANCATGADRKSTRLNFSHRTISYAVFCLKKKNNTEEQEVNR